MGSMWGKITRMKPKADLSSSVWAALAFSLGLSACAQPATSTDISDTTAEAQGLEQGTLLSAFFGLDNALPMVAHRICVGGAGQDGMPVITSAEVDPATMQAGDFRVLTADGKEGRVDCASFLPATDAGELRTILLIGEFGNDGDDPPASVEITGNLHSLDGTTNFKGAKTDVTPLSEGPFIVGAELVTEDEKDMGLGALGTAGSRCPAQGTKQQLRVIWAGGVTQSGGEPAEQSAGKLYKVTVRTSEGSERAIPPSGLADHEDPDNNHILCLSTSDEVVSVAFPAGFFTDPNEDFNPDTSVAVAQKE